MLTKQVLLYIMLSFFVHLVLLLLLDSGHCLTRTPACTVLPCGMEGILQRVKFPIDAKIRIIHRKSS